MKGRYKVILRSVSQAQINLPPEIWKQMNWKINDNLQIDIIKSGMHHCISITKEEYT
jgi:hypothetical protein